MPDQVEASHEMLVIAADKWLRQMGCGVVLTELRCSSITGEEPDAIGWRSEASILVEVKVSGIRIPLLIDATEVTVNLVISETDIEAALAALSKQHLSVFASDPVPWNRTRLLKLIRDAAPAKATPGLAFPVATKVWGVIQPLGTEFLGGERLSGYAIWLLIRECDTDLRRLVPISK